MGPQHEVRDVSGEETTTFCRDLPAENVQEMALVIANSTHADRTHKLKGNVNVKGRPGCSNWDGTTTTTIKQDGLTEVYLANYTFEPQWTRPLDGGGTESYFMAQGSYDMHASWSISGVSETDGCTYSGGTSWPAGVVGLQAPLDLRDAGQGNPATTYDFGYGLPFKSMMVQRVCPDGYTRPGVPSARHGLHVTAAPLGSHGPVDHRLGDPGLRRGDNQARVEPEPERDRALSGRRASNGCHSLRQLCCGL